MSEKGEEKERDTESHIVNRDRARETERQIDRQRHRERKSENSETRGGDKKRT